MKKEAGAKSRTNSVFLLFLAALVVAQSFFLCRQSEIAANLSFHQECDHQRGFEPPRRSTDGKVSSGDGLSIGQRIVERAYNETYIHLVNRNCPKDKKFKQCLERMYDTRVRKNITDGHWWFDTLLRDAANPHQGLHGPWHRLQFPKSNLDLCVFAKGGTKEWRHLHCIYRDPTFVRTPKNYFHCYQGQGDPSEDRDRAVFLRDPLTRFLSGFLDKCTLAKNAEGHCEPGIVFDRHKKNSFLVGDFLNREKLYFESFVDAFPLKWNLHFMPQAINCDLLYRDIDKFAFVGHMDHGFYKDLDRFSQQYPKMRELTDRIFNFSANLNTVNLGTERGAAAKLSRFYTARTVRKVLEYNAIDYKLLDIPIPEWAEEMLKQDELRL